jgi:hypothetical protein
MGYSATAQGFVSGVRGRRHFNFISILRRRGWDNRGFLLKLFTGQQFVTKNLPIRSLKRRHRKMSQSGSEWARLYIAHLERGVPPEISQYLQRKLAMKKIVDVLGYGGEYSDSGVLNDDVGLLALLLTVAEPKYAASNKPALL